MFSVNFQNELRDLIRDDRIEAGGRLIEEKNLGL
jgi:hypothetical protein